MKLLCLMPEESFPEENKKTLEQVLQNNNIELEYAQEPGAEHKGDEYNGILIAGDDKTLNLDIDLIKNILYKAMEKDKVVGAIDSAPALLAMAGILTGKCATVNDNNGLGRQLHNLGAMFFGESVVVDKNIVTGNSPSSAEEFANTVVELVNASDLDNRITCN